MKRYSALFIILLPSLILLFLIMPNTQAADNSVDLAQSDAWVAACCPLAFSMPCRKGEIRILDDLLPADYYIDIAERTNNQDLVFQAGRNYYIQARCIQDEKTKNEYGNNSWKLLNYAINNGHEGAISWLRQIQSNTRK